MKKLYTLLFIAAMSLTGCSGDDSNNQVQTNDPEPVITDSTVTDVPLLKLSKTITTNPTSGTIYTATYTYDQDRLIMGEFTNNFNNLVEKIGYTYNNNKLNQVTYYDGDVAKVIYAITYIGNLISQYETTFNFNGGPVVKRIFEYNSDNQIIQIKNYSAENYHGYRKAEWDTNNNVMSERYGDPDQPESYSTVVTYEYDNKINPTSKINSLHLRYFIQSVSKNNVVKSTTSYGEVKTWEYQYNDEGYPTWSKTQDEYGNDVFTEYFYIEN